MVTKRQRRALVSWIERIILIVLLIIAGKKAMEYFAPKPVDVTEMGTMKAEELERELGITLTPNSEMAKRIYHYSWDKISTKSTDGISVVYIGSRQVGLHIDNRKYSMYGLHTGYSEADVRKKMTYNYEGQFGLMTDDVLGSSNAIFYYNKTKNDCLVVIYNNYSKYVVAVTYFKDLKKMTERVSY